MALSRSKLTSQGQISVPAEVRRRLGLGPGSVLEWEEEGDKVFVRRSGVFSSKDLHRALFAGQTPARRTLKQLDEGLLQHVRERYARR